MSTDSLYHWLSGSPAVLFHSTSGQNDIADYLPATEKVYRFVIHLWHYSADHIETYHRQAKQTHPQHHLIHLANDFSVGRQLQARGIPTVLANHNCLLDESIYTIQPDVVRKYAAVYNARTAPYKRHELMSDLPSAFIIGGPTDPTPKAMEHFRKLQSQLPNTVFSHADNQKNFSDKAVATMLNYGRVGLCLSAVEGAMYAATEYLLCGLPVVSTASLGGRDAWFDPRFTRITPANPKAVAAAVQELAELNLCPNFIRSETVQRMTNQRRKIFDAGQTIYTAEGCGRDFARDFYERFQNKFGYWMPISEVLDHRPE